MSVARALGLADGVESVLLQQARGSWGAWVEREPVLTQVPGGVAGLQSWTRARAGDYDALDGVLLALARLAREGASGEGEAAAATFAWTLMGAAERLAWSLRAVSGEIEHLVAAHLWIQCRSVPPERRHKVAANVLYTVRTLVLADCGYGSRADPMWRRCLLVDPGMLAAVADRPAAPAAAGLDADRVELLGVLAGAAQRGVISARERRLLLDLVGACQARPGMVTGRNGGLTNRGAAGQVARRWGVAEVTIRRRAARAISCLADAGGRGELWPVSA